MSFIRVPPDGAGKKVYTRTHTVGADSVEAQVLHVADPTNPANLQRVDDTGAAAVTFSEGQPILSGFGSIKTANERALGVYESSLDTYEDLFSKIVAGAGLVTYDAGTSSEVLSVDGANGSSVIMLSNRYHYYIPGSSNIYKMTVACGDTGKVGNKRSWGCFDLNDGLFFQLHNTTLSVCMRSSVSGTVVETCIDQQNWNVDKLDGTGISQFNIDITKVNVYWIDYQWLGAGRVRFGVFGADGSRIVAHQFENAGQNPLPYMRTGTLPSGYANINTAITGATSELRVVCTGVYTEGTYEDYTFWRYADVDTTKTVTSDTHVFSLRARPTINGKHNSVVAFPETLNVYTDQPVAISFWQDTGLDTPVWEALASTLDVDYSGSINSLGLTKFKTIYCGAGVTVFDLKPYFELNDEAIQMNSDGTAEIWSVSATRLTGNATNISINLGYKELW